MTLFPAAIPKSGSRPTVLGKHNFTCAEYCGKGHSGMKGYLTVDNAADFAKWMETGGD